MVDSAAERLSSTLKSLLSERRMTQASLASKIGLSQAYVSQVLKGKRGIHIQYLDAMAQVFDVPIGALFAREYDRQPSVTREEFAIVRAYRIAEPKTKRAVCILLDVAEAEPSLSEKGLSNLVERIADMVESSRKGRLSPGKKKAVGH